MKHTQLHNLVVALEKASKQQKVQIWKAVAADLQKPTRQKREVNLSKISQNTAKDDSIIVPGKVLGTGNLAHPVNVVAYAWSETAAVKIKTAGGKIISINDELQKNAKGAKLRIIG